MRFPTPFGKKITYGYNWLEFDSTSKVFHPGIDINTGVGDTDKGEKIYPISSGVVEKIFRGTSGYGNQINIRHGNFYSKYAHLDTILVKEGDEVDSFDQIGTMGKSGTKYAHLHLEILTNELVKYIKAIKSNWWNFYPVSYQRDWVNNNYINPNMALQPKKLNILVILANGVEPDDYLQNLQILSDWFSVNSGGQLILHFDTVKKDFTDIPWVESKFTEELSTTGYVIDAGWTRLNICPLVSGYDCSALVLKEGDWKGNGVLGYAKYGKQLGNETMSLLSKVKYQSTQYKGFANNTQWVGILRHEIMHTLFDMSGGYRKDTTHLNEYDMDRDLSQCLKEIDYEKIVGWEVPDGKSRIFAYSGKPTSKKTPFSGIPEIGCVYRSTDYRFYFQYTFNGWKQISEVEHDFIAKQRVEKGLKNGEISVGEGNWIVDKIGGIVPPWTADDIIERVVSNWVATIWTKTSWSYTVPTKHLK